MTSLIAAVNYRTIRNALYDWADGVSGITVIWEKSDARRPQLPYVALNINTTSTLEGQDNVVHDTSDTYKISGQRSMIVSVKVHYAEDKDVDAIEMLTHLQSSLEDPLQQEALRASGIAVWIIGPATDISTELETGFENRIQMDVTFGMISSIDRDLGYIASTEVSGDIDNADGTDALDITEEIP